MYSRSLLALALVVLSETSAAHHPEPTDCEGVWAQGSTPIKRGRRATSWATYWAQSATPGAVTKRLVAGMQTEIGSLTASIVDGVLTASYSVDAGAPWQLTEADLYVGIAPPERVAPGRFPYHSGPIEATRHQFSIPLATFGTATTLYLAAHAEACSGGPGDPSELESGTVDSTGGTLTFPGLTIEVEPGELLDTVTFEVAVVPQPAALPAGATANGPTYEISLATGEHALDAPVTLRFTGLTDDGDPDTMLTVLHFNEALSKYEPLTLWDTADTYAVVESRAFSSFTPAQLAVQTAPSSYSLPGFTSDTKGWSIANTGSFITVGGNCAGMSSYAAWMYKAHPEENLFSKYVGESAQIVALRAQVTQSTFNENTSLLNGLSEAEMGLYGRAALAMFEEPLVLSLYNNGPIGHAAVIFGYDDVGFLYYDPNAPGMERYLVWDELDGFDDYDFGGLMYDTFWMLSGPSTGSYADFQMLYNEAERGYDDPRIIITEPSSENLNLCETLVTGTLTNPNWRRVSVYAHGQRKDQELEPGNHQFELVGVPLRSGENLLVVVAGEDVDNPSTFGPTAAARVVRVISDEESGWPVVDSVTPSGLVGQVDDTVVFTAATHGEPTSYLWDFADGTTDPPGSTDAQATVRLLTPGTHRCKLLVENACGYKDFEFTYKVAGIHLLDFEGIVEWYVDEYGYGYWLPAPIGEFYADRGVHFAPNFIASYGSFSYPPSGIGIAYWPDASSMMTFDADIVGQIDVSYNGDAFDIEIWSGPNATGTRLATGSFPLSQAGGFFDRVLVPFTGPARSVKFLSNGGGRYLDDLAFEYQSD